MSAVTYRVQTPHITGHGVADWQRLLNAKVAHWGVNYAIKVDDDYDVATRDLAATVLHGMGIAQDEMSHGVTPELRTKVRNARLTSDEQARYDSRAAWRKRLAAKHEGAGFASPLARIIGHSWGWTPDKLKVKGGGAVHDGVDLICGDKAPLFAICRAKVLRADASGWWGKGAHPSAGHPVSDGDGIIVLQSLVTAGPFKTRTRLCYGHAEGAVVKVGQTVEAGQHIGHAGFANASHAHFMVHSRDDARGIGDVDPWPYVAYAIEHAH